MRGEEAIGVRGIYLGSTAASTPLHLRHLRNRNRLGNLLSLNRSPRDPCRCVFTSEKGPPHLTTTNP